MALDDNTGELLDRLAGIDSQDEARQPVLDALSELADRELCRRRLLPYIMKSNPRYHPGWVHKDVCLRLERFEKEVVAGNSPRLMITFPPRHGKSEIASRTFPTWFLGRNPAMDVIACSHGASLAESFSRKARDLAMTDMHKSVFPEMQVDPKAQGIKNWMTLQGGGYLPAGVDGPIVGRGFNVGIIDDVHKSWKEADSENIRDDIWAWYTGVFYNRAAPGAGIILIMTRWHHDDLAGRLLEDQQHGGDKWELVEYPAIAVEDEPYRKKGEALHPERYDLVALERTKRVSGPRAWQALFQQKPTADEGDYFTLNMIRYYKSADLPDRSTLRYYTAWDLAVATKQGNDWSVGLTVAIDPSENLWVVDLFRKRVDASELVEEILDTWELWRSDLTGIEEGVIKHSIGPFLDQRIKERRTHSFNYIPLKVGRVDKVARARSIQGRMRQGRVFIPEDAGFTPDFVNELLQFPNAKHDDQVDALAHIGQLLGDFSTVMPGAKKKKKSWRDRLRSTTTRRSAMSA